ncbi:metal-dependent hydrolase family protein [Rhizohabitans arisaemae]|uniref:metal-dependent hydrolase family protein n=1 Tax=Rhizohabitans arisaemae TaxID=2720610 RepID=UPI0024B0E31F|nr:amidohydrolase family protein [Rhizohabitans arisaemae]
MIAIQGAQIIDGTGRDPIRGAAVRIDGDRIVGIGPVERDDQVIDMAGCTILPGLIDAHVHFGLTSPIGPMLAKELSIAERAANMFAVCEDTLRQGFTTVRDTGGIDWGLVRTVESGRIRGPRILCCGAILAQTGGHAHYTSPNECVHEWKSRELPGLATLSVICDSPDQVRAAARDNFRRGATFLKMNITGGIISLSDSMDDTQFTVPEIEAAVLEAQARKTYVTVHAHNNQGIRNGIAAGATCVEHGTDIDEELAEEMAALGVHLVPTLAVMHIHARDFDDMSLHGDIRERFSGVEAKMARAIKVATDAGVLVGSGTDYVGPKQDNRGLEIALRAEIVGAMQAIMAATSVNAEIIGVRDRVGTLEAGKLADVVAVDFDPLAEPHLFGDSGRTVLVVKDGEVVRNDRG